MVKAIQKKLSESKTARWSVLALVSFTMMCAYFISDIMSPLKTLLEKEIADAGIETDIVSPKLLPNYTNQKNI